MKVDLEKIQTGAAPPTQSLDERSILELTLADAYEEEKIKNIRSEREMREKCASSVLNFLKAYSSCVGVIVLLHGFSWIPFVLDEKIMITLVGSTAVAAIGLVGFVAKGLFK